MRKLITPVDFANVLCTAQALRSNGTVSKVEACRRACHEHGVSDDWMMPVLSFINDSPAAADAWAERMFNEEYARIAARVEGAQGVVRHA